MSLAIFDPTFEDLLIGISKKGKYYQLSVFSCVHTTLHSALSIRPSVHPSICHSVPFWAAAPKGPMTYAFTQGEIFSSSFFSFSSSSSSFSVPPLASKLKSQPQAQITVSSLNPRLRAQIPTLWLKSQLHRSYSNLLAQIPAL